jgi:diguanylate cyclase (GGDEF)-like protein
MSLRHKLAQVFIGEDPKLRRLLGYWGATVVFYILCLFLMIGLIEAGIVDRAIGVLLNWFGMSSVFAFYGLIRFSRQLGILPSHLALLQAMLAIGCNIAIYAITGPLRGATLIVMPVIIVFCTFSLRPRATLALCACSIGALGVTISLMMARDPATYPLQIEVVHFALASTSMIAVALLTGEMSKLRARLKRQKEELLSAVSTIRTLATVDELTSLANRRHMNEVLGAEERRQSAGRKPVCIALLDIDFFKSINDRYGHAGGDAVLRTFAGAVRDELRADDVLARWGGEEFLLMLPDTELNEATRVLNRMAERVGAMRISELDRELTITFSAGLVERCGGEPFADTISRADRAMYIAKSSGRNQVIPIGINV